MKEFIMFMTLNACYLWNIQKGISIVPTMIIIHSTATPGIMAGEWFKRWNDSDRKVGIHAFIDAFEFWQYLPFNMWAWGVGGKANAYAIQIEMCEDLNHEEGYFRKTLANTIKKVAEWCVKFNIPVNRVIAHYEAYLAGLGSNHADPRHWWSKFDYTMDDFRKDVQAAIDGPPVVVPMKPSIMYRVIISGKQIMALSSYENAVAKLKALMLPGQAGIVQKNTTSETLYSYSRPVPVVKPLATWQLHISGDDVRRLQAAANKYFGYNKLLVDGYYGDATRDGLPNNIGYGTRSALVGEIQRRLGITIDNSFGKNTRAAVTAFQVEHGLVNDGVVGRKTFSALYRK
ncbi:MAG: N-acetylmuramoyl-L-alanine amidase [Youngiibacter sp.]|nr:N-acetylmuramoyl-L-alanine amidase [Youngiibacter sp.]